MADEPVTSCPNCQARHFFGHVRDPDWDPSWHCTVCKACNALLLRVGAGFRMLSPQEFASLPKQAQTDLMGCAMELVKARLLRPYPDPDNPIAALREIVGFGWEPHALPVTSTEGAVCALKKPVTMTSARLCADSWIELLAMIRGWEMVS